VKIELSQLFLRVTIVDLLDAQGVLLWIDLPLWQNKTAPPTYDNINPAPEREAHVRTPIIEGKDAAAVEHDKDRTMAAMDNESALRLQRSAGWKPSTEIGAYRSKSAPRSSTSALKTR
jgi:hypothetical protein